ncbi:Dam family site-specific DNA-(adenine-N6)-methyltransferase [Thermoactinomyces daqus]|uniref:Site-specific DNA-methyltransferase (adenine-specific) n=1 Tax=Thermoactinomyces daqus TaxID=1329516 RepID=A0A7W1XD20_9BACL|nr:Dam family site-specific DNA-(adenine-N6)-methyltransferase [Thermoactinomyces daqus]
MELDKPIKVDPFLRWVGGKRWFVKHYSDFLPNKYNRYIEPFLGSGSVYFHLQPKQAILGDINEELIITYIAIRDNWKLVEEKLICHKKKHDDDENYYYEIRKSKPINPFDRAARFIYLNRTCFNGIYRVNKKGEFNVPKGTRNSVIFETDDFESVSNVLSTAEIYAIDFETLIDQSGPDDLVFADPPYTVRHNQNGFIKYNEKLFSWNDQIRLANALERAAKRGSKIISTNANHESIRDLYFEKGFRIETISRYSSICANPNKRNRFEEVVILNK